MEQILFIDIANISYIVFFAKEMGEEKEGEGNRGDGKAGGRERERELPTGNSPYH